MAGDAERRVNYQSQTFSEIQLKLLRESGLGEEAIILGDRIRAEAIAGGAEGKFSPLISLVAPDGGKYPFYVGESNKTSPDQAMRILCAGDVNANTGFDLTGLFGKENPTKQIFQDNYLFRDRDIADHWYKFADKRDENDLLEYLSLGDGRAMFRYRFTQGIESGMEPRRGAG